jgi:hypothetical protein
MLTKQAFDMHNALRLYLIIAESKMIKEEYKDAIKYCQVVLLMNEKLYETFLDNEALRITYMCEMKQLQWKHAKKTLKLCLECAWKEDDLEQEMRVYEKLSICHFYC